MDSMWTHEPSICVKCCVSNFEVKQNQILEVATNETTTLH